MGVKFYNVYFVESEIFGTGRNRSKDLLILPERGPITDWVTLELDLVEGTFPDYLASDIGCRLCSERMRRIVERYASHLDVLQWLPVRVFDAEEVRNYWVLHFPSPVSALGTGTIRTGDFVVKPVFSAAGLHDHAVLTYPGSEGAAWIVSEPVKNALAGANCTGLECTRATVGP